MSELKKKCTVVMLSTEKASNIWLRNKLEYNSSPSSKINPQHLYICSDEEIKPNDWYIDDYNNICKFVEIPGLGYSKGKGKIVATTDSSLQIPIPIRYSDATLSTKKLPIVSDSFIQAYIKAYNEGNPIINVMVQYDIHLPDTDGDFGQLQLRGNEIIITKVKDSWNKEEVLNLLSKYRLFGPKDNSPFEHDKWINKNI